MVILIAGASYTGKTLLSQRLLEKYKFPCVSIDHIKMGLIRSGQTSLTVDDDKKLTDFLWIIIKEIIKTVIENKQNIIIEGCYIPFDWKNDFDCEYLKEIKYYCLIMSERYIKENFENIKKYSNIIENRIYDFSVDMETMIEKNDENLKLCEKYNNNYILIDEDYNIIIEL
ncbi:MAG: ATP-binding protein [Clostridiales bacterium]|nr:ATP-binding protein [Clostridiales bacterium]